MKKFLLFLGFLLLGAALFTWVVQRIGWTEIWNVLLAFSGLKGFSILLLTLGILGLGAVRWRGILKSQGYQIPLSQIWQPYFASFALMFFTPMLFLGAELFRTYAARTLQDIPFQKALASNIIDRILEITVYLFVILLGVGLFLLETGAASPQVVWISFLVILLFGGAVSFFYVRSFRRKSILRLFVKRTQIPDAWELEQEIFRFFHWNNRAMWEGFLWSFLKSGTALLRAWALLLFLGKSVSGLAALSVLAFQYVALLIPIPASLGSHDALQAFALEAIGTGPSTGAAFALLIRSVEAIVAIAGIVLLARLSIVFVQNKLFAKMQRLFFSS